MELPKTPTTLVLKLFQDEEDLRPEEQLKRHLIDLKLHDIYDVKIHSAELERLCAVWEGFQNHDESRFDYNVQNANCLIYLLVRTGRESGNRQSLIRDILGKDKNNCFALLNKYHDARDFGDPDGEEEALMKLLKVLTSKNKKEHILRFRAEIAHIFHVLGTAYYEHSIEYYKTILKEQVPKADDAGSDISQQLYTTWEHQIRAQLKDDFVYWVFQLAQIYSKILTKPNYPIMARQSRTCPDFTRKKCYDTIRDYLTFVIKTEDKFLSGWAYAELALAFVTYTEDPDKEQKEQVTEDLTVDDCLKRALERCPENARVLMIVGRHRRTRAKDFNDLIAAKEYLGNAVKKNPSFHKGHHQLGLLYRELWLVAGRYKESITKRSKKTTECKNCQQGKKVEEGLTEVPQKTAARDYEDNCMPKHVNKNKRLRKDSRKTRSSKSHRRQKTACPNCQQGKKVEEGLEENAEQQVSQKTDARDYEDNCMPKHYEKSRPFDVRKANNPISKNRHDKYLKLAVGHMEKANKIVRSTSMKYKTDLARLYISQRLHEDAKKCFKAAEMLISRGVHQREAAYLFEQWGLFMEMIGEEKKAIAYFQSSLYYSLIGKHRSLVAYNKLRSYVQNDNNQKALLEFLDVLLCKTSDNNSTDEQMCAKRSNDSTEIKRVLLQLVDVQMAKEDKTMAIHLVHVLKTFYPFEAVPAESREKCLIFILAHKDENKFDEMFRWFVGKKEGGCEECPTGATNCFDMCNIDMLVVRDRKCKHIQNIVDRFKNYDIMVYDISERMAIDPRYDCYLKFFDGVCKHEKIMPAGVLDSQFIAKFPNRLAMLEPMCDRLVWLYRPEEDQRNEFVKINIADLEKADVVDEICKEFLKCREKQISK